VDKLIDKDKIKLMERLTSIKGKLKVVLKKIDELRDDIKK